MSLQRLKQDWEDLGELAPYWAVLTDLPRDTGGQPDLDDFFRTGQAEIDHLMRTASDLGHPAGRSFALDFGCGLGRLTRALAAHFERVIGVDISNTMVAQARELNKGVSNAEFIQNDDPHLGRFPDSHFDLIYTARVLQHLPDPSTIEDYVSEFIRVLKPGGLLAFQLPSRIPFRHRLQLRRRLYSALRRLGFEERVLFQRLGLVPMHMTAISNEAVAAFLARGGASLLHSHPDGMCGPTIESRTYYATR